MSCEYGREKAQTLLIVPATASFYTWNITWTCPTIYCVNFKNGFIITFQHSLTQKWTLLQCLATKHAVKLHKRCSHSIYYLLLPFTDSASTIWIMWPAYISQRAIPNILLIATNGEFDTTLCLNLSTKKAWFLRLFTRDNRAVAPLFR